MEHYLGGEVVARLGSLIRKGLSEQMRPSQTLTNKELPILWRVRAEFSGQKGEPEGGSAVFLEEEKEQ